MKTTFHCTCLSTYKVVSVCEQLHVGDQVVHCRAAAAQRRGVEVLLRVAARAVEGQPRGVQPATQGLLRQRARLLHQGVVVAHHHARTILPSTRQHLGLLLLASTEPPRPVRTHLLRQRVVVAYNHACLVLPPLKLFSTCFPAFSK